MTTAATHDSETGQAGRIATVYRLLAEDIKGLGVDAVFGLMSDDTADFAATLDMIGIDFHGARHENSAIVMAEGYAAATGRLGIAVVASVSSYVFDWMVAEPVAEEAGP